MNHFTKTFLSLILVLFTFVCTNAQHTLYIDTVKDGVKSGNVVSMSLRTKSFNGIVGFQGSLNWDTTTLAYNGITYGSESAIKLTASDVNVAANYLTFLWTDPSLTPNTVSDASILLTLSFTVKKDVIGISSVLLSNTPIPVQIVDSLIATPISLKSLSGNYIAGSVNLNWYAVNDISVSNYIVQRSNNGINFENIKSINALNKAGELSYSFKDQITSNIQNAYYRLLIIDHDGTYSFSKIIVVKAIGEKAYSLISYPNPVHKTMTIQINATKSQNVSLKIINTLGKQVHNESIQLNVGGNLITLDAGKYTPGNYFIVVDGDNIFTQQFIKF